MHDETPLCGFNSKLKTLKCNGSGEAICYRQLKVRDISRRGSGGISSLVVDHTPSSGAGKGGLGFGGCHD